MTTVKKRLCPLLAIGAWDLLAYFIFVLSCIDVSFIERRTVCFILLPLSLPTPHCCELVVRSRLHYLHRFLGTGFAPAEALFQ